MSELQKGQEAEDDASFDNDEYQELLEEVNQAMNAKESKAKKEEEREKKLLSKLENILKNIKNKKYKKARELSDKFATSLSGSEADRTYFVKNGKLEKSIENGKGLILEPSPLATYSHFVYYGEIRKGKPSGKGTYIDGDSYIIGSFKNGYLNGNCTIHYFSDANATWTDASSGDIVRGTYKNGWENGSFTWITKNDDHNDTYYYTSVMGKRKEIEMYKDYYVWAKSHSGWFYYALSKSALEGHHHVSLYKKQ